MKNNAIKKILSLLLVICMMASFAGCVPGEENPTEPSSIETTGPAESTTVPTDGTIDPTYGTEATESTIPTDNVTEPPATEAPNTDPTFATEIPTESPVETFVDVVETVYAISTVNVRSGPSTDDIIVGSLSYGESIQRTGIGNKGWSRVDYNGEEAYVYASYLSTTNPAQDTSGYPKTYSDATCDITISKEWYEDAWCYIAHLQFTDYTRFGTSCANGEYDNGYAASCSVSDKVLWQMLHDYPYIKRVFLCFDSDNAGKEAAKKIAEKLKQQNIECEILVPVGKDWNEDLLHGKEESA